MPECRAPGVDDDTDRRLAVTRAPAKGPAVKWTCERCRADCWLEVHPGQWSIGGAGVEVYCFVPSHTPTRADVDDKHAGNCPGNAPVRAAEPQTAPPARDQARQIGDGSLSVVCVPGSLLNIERPRHVGELAAAVSENVRTIFVTRDAAAWMELPESPPLPGTPHPFVDDAIAAGIDVAPAGLSWFLRVGGRGRGSVAVVLLGYDTDGAARPWSSPATSTTELVDGLAAFRRAVGARYGPTIGLTGERLLLATHPEGKGGARLDPAPVMPPALAEVHEIGTSWRMPTSTEQLAAATHVHWYDANANYLGAYQVAELGRGEPVNHKVDVDKLLTKYLPAGLWRATLPPAGGDPIPVPWSTDHDWHTSPTIARARELGVPVEQLVREAWVWPLSSRFCQPFGVLMRDARARLLADVDAPGHQLALAAVATVYQRLHGRFGAGFRGDGDAWHRPDWMHTLRAQARVNLDRRLRALTRPPFAVYVDAAYFLADVDDPADFADLLSPDKPLLGGRAELGRFRVAGSVELTDELRAALAGAHTANAVDRVLKAARDGTDLAPAATLLAAAPDEISDVDDGLDELAQLLAEEAP